MTGAAAKRAKRDRHNAQAAVRESTLESPSVLVHMMAHLILHMVVALALGVVLALPVAIRLLAVAVPRPMPHHLSEARLALPAPPVQC